MRTALCEAAWSAARTRNTYLAAQFRRFSRRFSKHGEGKAIFAVAHTMLVIIWHVLHDEVDYDDLGADYFERFTDTEAHARRLVRQLEKLGHRVRGHLRPAARELVLDGESYRQRQELTFASEGSLDPQPALQRTSRRRR